MSIENYNDLESSGGSSNARGSNTFITELCEHFNCPPVTGDSQVSASQELAKLYASSELVELVASKASTLLAESLGMTEENIISPSRMASAALAKFGETIDAPEVSAHICMQNSPQSTARFNQLIADKQGASESKSAGAFSYAHVQRVLAEYNLRRIGEEVYCYDPEFGVYNLLTDNALKTLIRSTCDMDSQSRLSRMEMIDCVERIRTEPSIQVPADYFDQNEDLVNFHNGTLDLQDNQFKDHSPDFALTSLIHANYIPDYHSLGTAFNEFLHIVCERDFMKERHLQEITGYNLSAYSGAKKATYIHGPRHTGKTTYTRMLQSLHGRDNVSNFSLAELSKRFTLGKLLGKKINVFGEKGAGVLRDVEAFKAITGGDWSETENKNQGFVSKPATTKLIFAGNSMPEFEHAEDQEAFMDRVTLIVFGHAIDKESRTRNMDELLLKERDIIVSWAIGGLKRLVQTNFVFSEADDALALRGSLASQCNIIDDFLEEHCIFQEGGRVFSKDLYKKYQKYCRENAFNAVDQTQLVKEVRAKVEPNGVVHKKIRKNGDGPYWGFENLIMKYEVCDFDGTAEQDDFDAYDASDDEFLD